jgi:hypothetical protein
MLQYGALPDQYKNYFQVLFRKGAIVNQNV